MSCTLEPAIQSGDTGQQIPFLTVVNIIDHNMDVHEDVQYQVKQRLYNYALNTSLVMPSDYKKTANQSARTIVAI